MSEPRPLFYVEKKIRRKMLGFRLSGTLKGYFQMGFNPNKERKHNIKPNKRFQNFAVSCAHMR